MDTLPAPEQPPMRKRGGRLVPMKKICQGPCQAIKLADEFDVDASKPDGRKAWCKACRAARRAVSEKNEAAEIVQHMDATVLAHLEEAPVGGTSLPHQTQALESLLNRLGGIEGFATFYVAQILASPPGSQQRGRMLDKILSAIQLCSDDAKVAKPRHLMSDEELNAQIKTRLERIRIAQETIEPDDVRESA